MKAKPCLSFLFALLFAHTASAQNLVPNTGFEKYQLNILRAPQTTQGVSISIEELVVLPGIALLKLNADLTAKVFQQQSPQIFSSRNILPLEHVPIYCN